MKQVFWIKSHDLLKGGQPVRRRIRVVYDVIGPDGYCSLGFVNKDDAEDWLKAVTDGYKLGRKSVKKGWDIP